MNRFLPFLFVTLTLSLCLTACQHIPDEPDRIVTLEEFFAPPADKVQSTADNIVVKGIRTKFVKGHLKADFKLYNNRGRRNVVNYRVHWFDKDGMLASPYDSWTTIALEGQQELIITATAPKHSAVDYKLELQTN